MSDTFSCFLWRVFSNLSDLLLSLFPVPEMDEKSFKVNSYLQMSLMNKGINLSFPSRLFLHYFKDYWSLFIWQLKILQEWGFSRLQNKGAKFLQRAEIFSHHAKIFEAHKMNFAKSSWYQILNKKNVFWQRRKKSLGCKNFYTSCNNFCMKLRKPLFAA